MKTFAIVREFAFGLVAACMVAGCSSETTIDAVDLGADVSSSSGLSSSDNGEIESSSSDDCYSSSSSHKSILYSSSSDESILYSCSSDETRHDSSSSEAEDVSSSSSTIGDLSSSSSLEENISSSSSEIEEPYSSSSSEDVEESSSSAFGELSSGQVIFVSPDISSRVSGDEVRFKGRFGLILVVDSLENSFDLAFTSIEYKVGNGPDINTMTGIVPVSIDVNSIAFPTQNAIDLNSMNSAFVRISLLDPAFTECGVYSLIVTVTAVVGERDFQRTEIIPFEREASVYCLEKPVAPIED